MSFPDGYESRRRAIQALEQQTIRAQIELVMVTPAQIQFHPDPSQVSVFGSHQVIELEEFLFPGRAFASGISAARAPIVAYVEEHSFPEPTWAEVLVRAHAGPFAAVGCAMGNANPNTLCSWINMFEEFGPIVAPAASHVTTYLGGHHTTYKREILFEFGNQLENLLENETALHIALRARGHQLFLAGDAVSSHVNISQVWAYLRQDFTGQRSFAATRARVGNWSAAKRALYILAAPLIPFVRLRRVLQEMQRAKRASQLLPHGLPLLWIALVCGTAGEVVGYLVGDSDTNIQRKSEAEFHRARFLAAEEKNA